METQERCASFAICNELTCIAFTQKTFFDSQQDLHTRSKAFPSVGNGTGLPMRTQYHSYFYILMKEEEAEEAPEYFMKGGTLLLPLAK